MKVKRAAEKRGVCVFDMREGDVGEIVEWSSFRGDYIGLVVCRTSSFLHEIGGRGANWPDFFNETRNEGCRVELLKPGDSIVFTEE
jgi:hypothetical protein